MSTLAPALETVCNMDGVRVETETGLDMLWGMRKDQPMETCITEMETTMATVMEVAKEQAGGGITSDAKVLRWARLIPTLLAIEDLPYFNTSVLPSAATGCGHGYGWSTGKGKGYGPDRWDPYGDGWGYGNGKGRGTGYGYDEDE